jgi:CBS domain-containing protein
MTEKGVDSVLVVDKSGDGSKPEVLRHPNIVGIMTVKDVVNRVVAKGRDPSKTKVSDVMTSPVKMVEPTTTLYSVALLMNQSDFRQVPVMDKYKIRGIITSRVINMSIITDIIDDIKLMATIFR